MDEGSVRLEPWGPGDLSLLERALGDPAMTVHLGGPESPEKLAERQSRYERPGSGQFRIVLERTGEPAGWVGYWERAWRDETVFEIGWAVFPEHQGRGIATAGTRLAVEAMRKEGKHRYVHAFPSVENPPSNAICRKVGFELLGAYDVEYPKGSWMRCNDWRLDLAAGDGEGAR